MLVRDLENFSPSHWFFDVRDQLKRHVYDRSDRAFEKGDADRDAIKNTKALDRRRRMMRKKFIEGLGGLPPMTTPLNSKIIGRIEEKGFHIEKIIFESRPKVFVTANLYIPDGITQPRGAVLLVAGHGYEAKAYPSYQVVCRYLVKAGLVVMAQDPVGQGERLSYYEPSLKGTTVNWGTREHDYVGSQCLAVGDSLARYFVHDSMRSVDYLSARPEVDRKKIGITGSSGGGTQTCLMMVCDPRLAAAAPGTFLMNRQTYMHSGGAQDAEQIWPGMTALGFDHEDVLLMMVPKPVRVLAVTSDFFPIEGTRRTVRRCKRFWAMSGQKADLDLVEDFSTHEYTRTLAQSAAEFFSKHLLGKKVTVPHRDIEAIDNSKLWCTKSGQVRSEIPGAKFVFEENLERIIKLSGSKKTTAIKWLRDRVFTFRKPCDLNPRFFHKDTVNDLFVQVGMWWSQEGIFNGGMMFRDYHFEGKDLPVTVAVWDKGTAGLQPHMNWLHKTCQSGQAVLVLDVSGVGTVAPNPLHTSFDVNEFYGAIHKFNDDLIWLSDSIAALRVYDVIRSLDMLETWPKINSRDIRFYAHGRQGIYPILAAALDKRIKKVESTEKLAGLMSWAASRHYNERDIRSVIIPGMLKYFGLGKV
jgi:cephalosporin-C deacetylase-like acetyl esterase